MNTIIHAFGEFNCASRAREALLHSGFAADRVTLESRDEEAGPVQGDFILADKGSDRVPSVQRGTLVLTVAVDDDREEQLARSIVADAARGDGGERMEG